MSVAIYHPFHDLPDNYSLSHVVVEQMHMLLENGYECHFITSEDFQSTVPKKVMVHNILSDNEDDITDKVSGILALNEIRFVLTHDVVYQKVYKEHEAAIRNLTTLYPKVKWFHWSHSAPRPSDPREPMANSTYIGLNQWDLPRLAEQFGVPEAHCRLVYNSVSPDLAFKWHPFTRKIVEKHSLLDCDILMILPFDTGRWDAKGGPKVIKLVQKLRDRKLNAKVVFINAAANDDGRRKQVEGWVKGHEEYVIFTSREGVPENERPNPNIYFNPDGSKTDYHLKVEKEWKEFQESGKDIKEWGHAYPTTTSTTTKPPKKGKTIYPYEEYVPRRVVLELMQVGNVFPLLSRSEACSISMLEAGLCGMIVILNADFPPFMEFGRTDLVFWMKVSSDRSTTNYGKQGEDGYYAACAQNLHALYERHSALRFKQRIQKRFNRAWIFKHQLGPLLER